MKPKIPQEKMIPGNVKSEDITKVAAPKSKKSWILYGAVAFFISTFIIVYIPGKEKEEAELRSDAQVLEVVAAQKLASVDAESPVLLDPDNKSVQKTNSLLLKLSETYHEQPEDIANDTYVAHQQLVRNGVQETNYHILEHMNSMPPTNGIKYKQAVIAYVKEVGQK